MSLRFEHEEQPARIVFGAGRLKDVAAEADRFGAVRIVLVAAAADERLAAPIAAALGDRLAGRIDEVRQHVPEEVAEAARARFAELDGDLLVCVGGGSTIGTAKAIALTTGTPILAVPTTYAGSEMTPIWGITAGERKTTGVDARVLPRTVVYDPELTVTLPADLSAASGMNGLAHCAEALWVERGDPLTGALAEEGIRAFGSALPRVVDDPEDLRAREEALLGACLGGRALAMAGTGLHHKLAHVLGGTFGLPHAEVHSVLLPYTTRAHASTHPAAMVRIARALAAQDAAQGLWDLGRAVGAPMDLGALGLSEAQAEEAAGIVAETGVTGRDAALEVLRQALQGERPAQETSSAPLPDAS